MSYIYEMTLILILLIALAIQGYYVKEYQKTAEEALEIAGKWQEAYTELQQDYSQAVEKIEWLEYELGVKSE
ncbi:hypothetical protein [Jeotgalicoccus sp. WY2]|uniref:hypothetical protein n=1 Tax=Jeotgalicoccus sp. WY2 TaxID=2708346 RepID=UPI001BD5145A|nr:hypothetical protein [Jeotgalicoccus sp. WY2]